MSPADKPVAMLARYRGTWGAEQPTDAEPPGTRLHVFPPVGGDKQRHLLHPRLRLTLTLTGQQELLLRSEADAEAGPSRNPAR